MGNNLGSMACSLISILCLALYLLSGDAIHFACTIVSSLAGIICAAIESLKDNKKSPD